MFPLHVKLCYQNTMPPQAAALSRPMCSRTESDQSEAHFRAAYKMTSTSHQPAVFNLPTSPPCLLNSSSKRSWDLSLQQVFLFSQKSEGVLSQHLTSNPCIGCRQNLLYDIPGLSVAEAALHIILQVVMTALHTNTQPHTLRQTCRWLL